MAQRNGLIIGGGALIALGLALVLSGFATFESQGNAWFESSKQAPFGDHPMPSVVGPMTLMALGVVAAGVGGFLLKLGLVGPVANLVAADASPALEKAATAISSGVRQGWGAPSSVAQVRVRCGYCASLESQDAKFCSQCATAMA